MYYICIENNAITTILNYHPNVPSTVSLVEITDQQYEDLVNNRKRYDVQSRQFVDVIVEKTQEQITAEKQQYLRSTDWKVLRHIREKSLGLQTSLTEEEYLALENERQAIAQSI